jgi:hypothetical protein
LSSRWSLGGNPCFKKCQGASWQSTHLLVSLHEVHGAVVVVVVVRRLGGVGGQHQVVGPQAVALRVGVGEDARLQQLVVRVPDAWHDQGGAERLQACRTSASLAPRHRATDCLRPIGPLSLTALLTSTGKQNAASSASQDCPLFGDDLLSCACKPPADPATAVSSLKTGPPAPKIGLQTTGKAVLRRGNSSPASRSLRRSCWGSG